MSYVHGFKEDEKLHRLIHTEYSQGPLIAALQQTPRIGLITGLPVHVVDSSVSFAARCKVAHVAMVGHRSMSSYPAGYDGTVTEDDLRLYVVADKKRAVAFVLTALEDRFWHLAWKADGNIDLFEQTATLRRGHKVGRVWVAANYRRKGLSKALVQLSVRHLDANVTSLGWELPLTELGRRLVQSLSPNEFWGCGDSHSIYETLHPDYCADAT